MTTLPQVYNEGGDLSPAEEIRLIECENIIQEHLFGFVVVGLATKEIRDKRLYRKKYRTWDEYSTKVLDMAKRVADQYIAAAQVVENLGAIAPKLENDGGKIALPANEAQARELAKLPSEEQGPVWQILVASGEPITAKAIRKAVLSFKGKALVEGIEKSKRKIRENRTEFQSEAFSEAFDRFFDQLNEERNANWRFTSRKTVYRILQGLIDLVAEAVPGTLEEYGCTMELSDREKLKKGGFRIFRMDAKNKLIEEWHSNDSWNVLMECKNPKMLHDSFAQLMENHQHLRG
jgi:hypothetical protein